MHTMVSTDVFVASPHSCQEGDLSAQVRSVPETAALLLALPEPLFEARFLAPHRLQSPYLGADHLVFLCFLSL